jgi:DNA polymerase-3 subunit epsilon
MDLLEGPLVFVDLETNGLSYVRGRVIEVAAIRVEHGEIVATMDTLLDPEAPLPAFITTLTGITNSDVQGASVFADIAEELQEILSGAIFVAHNVRFDYSFLKQEFKRLGMSFQPRQLCTMRLSRTLYPQYKSHKLEQIIQRFGFSAARRHRAYDDAAVLWDFLRHIRTAFETDQLEQAIRKQLRAPSLPKGVDAALVAAVPDTSGVYIFEDEKGYPLYVGKSIHLQQRVRSHFMRDHEQVHEFKIAQQVRNITIHETSGELEALLLESQLVKDLQPLYNQRLRRTTKMLLVTRQHNEEGYATITYEEASAIDPDKLDNVLAVYPSRSKAKAAVDRLMKDFSLCPKLCGLEKAKDACFMHQLRKCAGACVNKEDAEQYNNRLAEAFSRHRIQAWPYKSPILVTEGDEQKRTTSIVIDQWCIVGRITQEGGCSPVFTRLQRAFDLDAYKILQSHLTFKKSLIRISPLSEDQLQGFFV